MSILLLLSHFSPVRLSATPWTAAYQAPPSMGFSRQEYWSGLPLPSPLDEHKELYIEIHEYVSLDEHKEVHERIKVVGHLPSNLYIVPYLDFARRVHFPLQWLNMLGISLPVSRTVSTWKCNPILANRIEQKSGKALRKFSFPARREYMGRIRFLWMVASDTWCTNQELPP